MGYKGIEELRTSNDEYRISKLAESSLSSYLPPAIGQMKIIQDFQKQNAVGKYQSARFVILSGVIPAGRDHEVEES